MSSNGPSKSGECPNEQSKPEHTCEELPPLRPFLSLKHFFGFVQGEQPDKHTGHHYDESPAGKVAWLFDFLDRWWRRCRSLDSNTVMAAFTAFLFVVAVGSLQKLNEQIADQRIQTRELVRQTGTLVTQVNEMKKQSGAMLEQNKIAVRQLEAMADQNKTILEQTKLAEGQLEQMRLEQRAWLGLMAVDINKPTLGEAVSAILPIHNSGRTPGTIMYISVSSSVHDNITGREITTGLSLDQCVKNLVASAAVKARQRLRQTVLPPDTRMPFNFNGDKATKPEIEALEKNSAILYLYGAFFYRDTTRAVRSTLFCFQYDPTADSGATAYDQHNHMD